MEIERENPTDAKIKKPDNTLGIGILLIVALIFFGPLWLGDQVIFYRDFTFTTFPFRYFLAQTFHEGALPYWNTNAYGGMPFMAGFHPGVFYPPSILLLLSDTVLGLNLFYIFHFILVGIFSFLLARSWGISFGSALCCGITGMLSGFLVASTLLSNLFLGAVWLPLIFWAFQRFWTSRHKRYFAVLVLAVFAQTLAACPEMSILTLLLLYTHSLYLLPRARWASGFGRVTLILGLAVALALSLAALQLIPTAKLVDHSFRDKGLSFEMHAAASLEPSKLSTLMISPDYGALLESKDSPPWFNGLIHTLYMGILAVMFILIGFLYRREKNIRFWLVVFFGGLFLAFGKYNPVYEFFYPWIPLLNKFRIPEKYFLISSYAAVFLTGFILDALVRDIRQKQFKIISFVGVFIVMLVGTFALSIRFSYLDPVLPLIVLVAFGLSLAMYHYNKIGQTVFGGLVCVLVLFDLGVKDVNLLPTIDRSFYDEKPLIMDIVGETEGKYRVYSGMVTQTPNPDSNPDGPTWMDVLYLMKEYARPFNGMITGVENAGGLPGLGLELRRHVEWYRALIKAEPEKRFRILKRSNVKYWVDADTPTTLSAQGKPLILPSRVKVWDDALPRAFMVGRFKVQNKEEVLDSYYDESFDPLSEVLFSVPVDFKPSPEFSGKVQSVSYQPNRVSVKTSQKGSGFLVLLDSYFPGWTVRVDGEEQPILKANHFYRAVQLGPGEHTLEFEFFPVGFREGLMISSAAAVVLLALPLWGRWLWPPGNADTLKIPA